MKVFYKLKHWQLFVVLFLIPFLVSSALQVAIFLSFNSEPYIAILYLFGIAWGALLLGWLYSVAMGSVAKLPTGVSLAVARFRLFILAFVAIIALSTVFSLFVPAGGESVSNEAGLLIFAGAVFGLFCAFHSLWFTAKALKSVELGRAVSFSDFGGDFMALWFLPIGVWIIQPKVNRLLM